MMPIPQTAELTEEERSKDAFFQRIASIGEEMIAAHGREFATGAFVLAARWISDGRMGAKAPQGDVVRPN